MTHRNVLLAGALLILLAGVLVSCVEVDTDILSDNGHTKPAYGHIGGSATDVIIAGDRAYVGYVGELAVLDIADVFTPQRIGYAAISVNDLATDGSRIYAAGSDGLRIIDVSAPSLPQVVGYVNTPRPAMGVSVVGQTAYVVTNRGGLHVVDVNRTRRPKGVGFIAVNARLPDIAVAEPYAYIAANKGLYVVDVSVRHRPQLAAFLDLPGFAADLALVGDRLFLTNEFQGLVIIDVSDPCMPDVLQNVPLDSMVWDVEIVEGIAYVASTAPGLHVVDNIDSSAPMPVFHAADPDSLWALAWQDGRLFGVNLDGDLHIFDLTDCRHPVSIGAYDVPGYSTHVAAHSGRVYVVADIPGSVYHLNPAVQPNVTRKLAIAPDFTVAIAATDDGFVASGEATALWAGVEENGGNHRYVPILPAAWPLREVVVEEQCIYGIGEHSEFLWVDDLAVKPLRYGMLELSHRTVTTIATSGKYIYVGSTDGLLVYVHEPGRIPDQTGFIATVGRMDLIRTDGLSGFAVIGRRALCAVDFTNRKLPRINGCVDLAMPIASAALLDKHAYVALRDAGVVVVSLEHPAQPSVVGQIETIGHALDVAALDDTLYVAAGAGGLLIFQVTDAGFSAQE